MTSMDEARRWLQAAEDDLRFARFAADGGFFAQACFHAQQAAEKAVKAVHYAGGARAVPLSAPMAHSPRMAGAPVNRQRHRRSSSTTGAVPGTREITAGDRRGRLRRPRRRRRAAPHPHRWTLSGAGHFV